MQGFNVSNPNHPWKWKGRADALDYTWDLSEWLAEAPGDSISAVAIAVTGGITEGSGVKATTHTTTTINAWLSGGDAGAVEASATAHVTTAGGRVKDFPIYLKLK